MGTAAAAPPEAREALARGAAEQARLLREGRVRAPDLVAASLERIAELDPLLGAFRTVLADEARATAEDAQRRLDAGEIAPLLGVPVAVKDTVQLRGHRQSLGTAVLGPPAPADAAVAARLRAAGAVVVGVTHMPELALWPFTEGPAFGTVRNPADLSRTAGGSSGGSAAAVAAGIVALATASDGGGSIRIPAACCGLVGLKPTPGRVPLTPERTHWHGLSAAGVLTRDVADTALALDVLSDPLPGEPGPPSFAAQAARPPGRLRVAWSTSSPVALLHVEPVVAEALQVAVGHLADAGHDVGRRDPDWGLVDLAFVPRYLRGARDDWVRLDHPDGVEPRTRRVARLGSLLGEGTLRLAARQADALRMRLARFFADADVLVTPVLASPAVPAGRWRRAGALATMTGVQRWMGFTPPWNAAGYPAVSVPTGTTPTGLPLAVQVVAPPGREGLLLQVAAQLEAAHASAPRAWSRPRVAPGVLA